MQTSSQIRNDFIEFFKSRGHTFVPSSPLVPAGDDTLLFANAGMNQFKDIFLGLSAPTYRRAANSQKCLRVSGKHNDLDEVGRDSYHHTFFEMLGNWSFDDYFKAEAIEWAWELFTKVWGIDADKLWASVFAGDEADKLPRDEEAAKLWTKVTTIKPEHVLYFGRKDNFWEMGAAGPCGPCSEIHIDLGPEHCDKKNEPGHKCAVNGGCARYIELWNLVFIQYNRSEAGILNPLGARYIDTGAGLERLAAVLQKKKSNYDTDLFSPIIGAISDITGHKYTHKLDSHSDTAFRVVADHIRALTFAITDGASPSNEGRGYCVRRILRRGARFGRELGMHEPFIYKLTPVVVDCLGGAFDEIRQRADYVSSVIKSEEESFGRTVDRGIEIFSAAAERAKGRADKTIDGEDAFQLYDTYGFPLDLTELMARESGLGVDTTKFEELMDEQRTRARAAQKGNSLAARLGGSDTELPVTEDMHKYKMDSCRVQVVGFLDSGGYKDSGRIEKGAEAGVVLDKTCFYAESGGQVGDTGTISIFDESGKQKALFIVDNTARVAGCVIHRGKVVEGAIAVGDKVKAVVSRDRDSTRKNHTATHLLQWALQQTAGKAVTQQGSLVSPDYLRFDFTCPAALTGQQIKEVEKLVREKIADDSPVTFAEMARDEAKKLGAMALFSEKYGDRVRVVCIGTDSEDRLCDAFSREFCGGTHVERLGLIGGFKIIKEESVSAGVRRITALTGGRLEEYLEKRSDILDTLSALLKVPAEGLIDRVNQLLVENKKLAKEAKGAAKQSADGGAQASKLLEKAEKIGDSFVIVGRLADVNDEQARGVVDMLKKKAKSAAILLATRHGGSDGKVMLLAGVTEDLIAKGLSAGDIVKNVAPIVGGGGGGKAHLAQAGGKNPEKIDEALAAAAKLIKEKLKG